MSGRSYVYVHKLDDIVVYVGIGTGDRFKCKLKRQPEHLKVWDSLVKVKVAENISKEEAHSKEQELLDEHFDNGNLFNVRRNSDKVKIVSYIDVSTNFYYDESSPSKLRHKYDKFCGAYKSVKVANAGDSAGNINKLGYYFVSINNKRFLAHRVVYCLISGEDLSIDKVIDHIDGNRSNNSITNIRLVTRSENSRNKLHKQTNTGYQSITDNINKKYFSVGYRLNYKSYRICFSYNPRTNKVSRNHYDSRELALLAALEFRDKLVEQGLITITMEVKELKYGTNKYSTN